MKIDDMYFHKDSDLIQLLEDGEYVLEDEACYVDERDEYHLQTDCIYNSYNNTWHLREDLEIY